MPGILNWNLGDSSIVDGNTISHTYTALGNKTVIVNKGTTDGSLDIVTIQMQSQKIIGTFDVSTLKSLTSLQIGQNPGLTNVILPDTSSSWAYLYLNDTSIGPSLDLSKLTKLGGTVQLQGNKKLKYVTNPSTNATISYNVGGCDITGTLDISSFSSLNYFYAYDNPHLNYIINPKPTASTIQAYHVYGLGFGGVASGLMGTLDLSALTTFSGVDLQLQNNPSLNYVINPSTGNTIQTYNISGYPYAAYPKSGLIGTHDMRPFSRFGHTSGTTLNLEQNPSLNNVLFSRMIVAGRYISQFNISYCDIRGIFDVSGLVFGNLGSGATIDLSNNPRLNNVIFPRDNSRGDVTNLYLYNCGLVGTLDCSGLKRLAGNLQFSNNPSLNEIKFADTSRNMTYLAIAITGITTLDLRPFKAMGGTLQANDVSTLNTIINSDSSRAYTTYNVQGGALIGTLDLSICKGGFQYLYYDHNPSLNFVRHPSTNVNCDLYQGHDCNLLGTADLEYFSSPRISYFHGNPNLQVIKYRTFTRAPYILNHFDCSLTTACIDDILQKSYDWFSVNPPTLDYTLSMSGGNSAMPSVSGSTNIANLITIFSSEGKTLIIQVN